MLNDKAYSCHWSDIKNWDHNIPLPDYDGKLSYGLYMPCLADFIDDYLWDNGLAKEKTGRRGCCELIRSQMGEAVSCCIRAACDVAVAPSAGVLGWTVHDLKQMWKGSEVPSWVKKYFQDDFETFKDADPVWL